MLDKDKEAGDKLANELSLISEKTVRFFHCDVAEEDALLAAIGSALPCVPRLDCLINNAGWHPPHLPIDKFSRKDAERVMAINFFSAFSASKRCLPMLREVKGNIINLSSYVGVQGQLDASTYAATKGHVLLL